jgi:putative addiction module CopG family antidote
MSIQLTPEQAKFVQSQLQTGRYQTIEEVVAAAFQSLALEEEEDEMDKITLEEDLQRIQRYRETGKGIPHEQVLEWLSSIGTDHELPCPSGN